MVAETMGATQVTMGAGHWQLGHQGQTRASRLGHYTQASSTRLPGGLEKCDNYFIEEEKS